MEPITEMKNGNETSAGSLGLGAALAVAYDLPDDPAYTQPNYVTPEVPTVPLATTAGQPAGVYVLAKNGYYAPMVQQAQPVRYQAGDPYWAVTGYAQPQQSYQQSITSTGVPMTAYLNPIPVSSPSPARLPENGSYFLQTVPHQPFMSETGAYIDAGPASESTMSTDSMLSIRSDTVPNYQPAEIGYTIKSVVPQPIMPNPMHHMVSNNVTNNHSRRHEDQRQAAVPSTGSDDGLYELSEEDVREIDDMVRYTGFGFIRFLFPLTVIAPFFAIETPLALDRSLS